MMRVESEENCILMVAIYLLDSKIYIIDYIRVQSMAILDIICYIVQSGELCVDLAPVVC